MKIVNLKVSAYEAAMIIEALQNYYLDERVEYFKYLGDHNKKEDSIIERGEQVDNLCSMIVRELNYN